ncbi:MAG: transposase [Peptoniphilaceae bacterium]|nr:transposase [Peptoniphilaceae bacterium]
MNGKERDEYLENKAYQRDPDRKTYRNGYYDRAYTTKIGSITLRVPRLEMEIFLLNFLKDIKEKNLIKM